MLFLCVAAEAYLPANGGVSFPVHYFDVLHPWGNIFYAYFARATSLGHHLLCISAVGALLGQQPQFIFACAVASGGGPSLHFCVCRGPWDSSVYHVCVCGSYQRGIFYTFCLLRAQGPWVSNFYAFFACVAPRVQQLLCILCVSGAPWQQLLSSLLCACSPCGRSFYASSHPQRPWGSIFQIVASHLTPPDATPHRPNIVKLF